MAKKLNVLLGSRKQKEALQKKLGVEARHCVNCLYFDYDHGDEPKFGCPGREDMCDAFINHTWTCDKHCYLYPHCRAGQAKPDGVGHDCRAFALKGE